jgi:chaperonin GroEL
MILETIKQASYLTNEQCGDGTTTTAVLASNFYLRALRWLQLDISAMHLLSELGILIETLLSGLTISPIKTKEDLENIATISANGNRELGKLMADVVAGIGKDGSVLVEDSRSYETSVEFIEGFRLPSGYISPSFITEPVKSLVQYEDAFVLVTNFRFEKTNEFLPVLELVARSNRPLLIVAEEVEGQAISSLIANASRGTLKVAAVKAPFFGEEKEGVLHDLAIFLNATMVDRNKFLDLGQIKLTDLGHAKTVEIKKNLTTLIGGYGDISKIQGRIQEIRSQIVDASLEEAKRLQERISRLASSVAIVRVGGSSEIEIFQKKLQIDDCIGSLRSAKEEGVILGGGVSLVRSLLELPQETEFISNAALDVLRETIFDLLRLLSQNSKIPAELVVEGIKSGCKMGQGYDFEKDRFCNMREEGIIEPAKNIRCALRNAFSVASALLLSKSAIVEE